MKEEKPKVAELYSPVPTVVFTIAIYFASQLLAGVLISIIPLIRHWSAAQTNAWLRDNVWASFAFVAIVEAITLYLVHLLLKKKSLNFRSIGFKSPRPKHIAYALCGFGVYFVLYIIALAVIKAFIPGLNLEQKQEIGFNTTTSGISLLPVFLSLVILPPITEEIVARGFLFGGLRTKLSFIPAAIVTSILFASPHLAASSVGLLWVAGIDTFMLSLVLCYLREKTGSLWPSIGVHMLKNGLAFIVLFNLTQYIR